MESATWEPDLAETIACNNGYNNEPEVKVFKKCPLRSVFYVSQNAQEETNKLRGQDCLGRAAHKEWICNILCDGHGEEGYEIAEQVCKVLPPILLRLIHEREDPAEEIGESLIEQAFADCEAEVNWADTPIKGKYSVVTSGEYSGKVGYLDEISEDGKYSVLLKHFTSEETKVVCPFLNV